MKKYIGIMMVLLAVAAGSAFAASGLDDSVWKASLGKDSSQEDILVFVKGQFTSTKCVPYGYGTSAYTTTKSADGTSWKAEQTSGKDKTTWEGVVKGDTMSGHFTHPTGDGKKVTEEWTATKQAN